MGLEADMADQEYMMKAGLTKYDANDYIQEIGSFDWDVDDLEVIHLSEMNSFWI